MLSKETESLMTHRRNTLTGAVVWRAFLHSQRPKTRVNSDLPDSDLYLALPEIGNNLHESFPKLVIISPGNAGTFQGAVVVLGELQNASCLCI